MKKITDIAKVIRSKNSSPFDLTLDIILKNAEYYKALKEKNAITRELIAKAYGVPLDMVGKVVWFDPANAVKAGLRRSVSSGAPGDSDVYGAQQHAPLLDLEFDI
jgi:hypothetical protein